MSYVYYWILILHGSSMALFILWANALRKRFRALLFRCSPYFWCLKILIDQLIINDNEDNIILSIWWPITPLSLAWETLMLYHIPVPSNGCTHTYLLVSPFPPSIDDYHNVCQHVNKHQNKSEKVYQRGKISLVITIC